MKRRHTAPAAENSPGRRSPQHDNRVNEHEEYSLISPHPQLQTSKRQPQQQENW